MAEDDIGLLHEIDEAMRVERLQRFWQRFGKIVIAGCIGILLLTAARVIWQDHMRSVHTVQTGILLQARAAAEAGKTTEATRILEDHHDMGDLAALAALQRAGIAVNTGDMVKARSAYGEAARNRNTEAALRNFAAWQDNVIAYNQQKTPEFMDAGEKGRPFAPLAQETEAVHLLNNHKNAQARTILQSLADNTALSSSQRERVMDLLSLAGGKAP